MAVDPEAGALDYCYVTTRGRVTGDEHTIEIWFALNGMTLYMLSGGRERSDWVRNIRKTPDISVRFGETTYAGRGRIVEDKTEDALARRLLLEKYTQRYSGGLSDWGKNALPVAVDLEMQR